MTVVENVGSHAVDLTGGRQLGPGQTANVDLAQPNEAALQASGQIVVVDPSPPPWQPVTNPPFAGIPQFAPYTHYPQNYMVLYLGVLYYALVTFDSGASFNAGDWGALGSGNTVSIPLSQKGAASGVGTLDSGGKQPVGQLAPSVVTDSRGSGAGADVPMNGHTLSGLGPLTLPGGTVGQFTDFATGAPGVAVLVTDPGSPTPFDLLHVDPGGALTYDSQALAPMTRSLKITATSAAEAAFEWSSFGKLARTTTGRAYINMSANPGQTLRLVQWFAGGVSKGFIQITGGRLVQICDQSGSVVGAATALSITTDYRLEWSVTRESGGGGNGVVTLNIYAGHSTTPLQTIVSSAFQTGTYIDKILAGSANNSNLGAMALYLGAFADGCVNAVGPYTGPPAPTAEARSPDGTADFGGFQFNGQFVLRARADQVGDSSHYKYRAGMRMFRLDEDGNAIFGPSLLAARGAPVGGASVPDAAFNVATGRFGARSFLAAETNDPPDITFTRFTNRNNDRAASDGVTNGAVFSSATANFQSIDVNKGIVVAATSYFITTVDSPTQAHLENADGTPAALANATGVAWSISTHPYPSTLDGVDSGTSVGQFRVAAGSYAYNRSSSDAGKAADAVVNGTTTLTSASAAFTTADTGRKIMLNNDVARIYSLTYVSATQVTLDRADANTASGVAWAIVAKVGDGGAVPARMDEGTFGFTSEDLSAIWDAAGAKNYGPMSAYMTLASKALYAVGADVPVVMRWRSDGRVEIPNRLTLTDPALTGLANAPTDTQLWRSAAARAKTNALLDATTLGVASKVKAGTPVDGDWASAPPDGTLVGDSTGLKAYIRLNGSFVDVGSSVPTIDTHANRLAAAHARGHQWLETDTGLLYVDDGTNWQILRRDGSVPKTANQTVNNSNALVNDTDLHFPIEPNEIWFVEAVLWVTAASVNADWLLGWSGPTGADARWGWMSGTNGPFTMATTGASPALLKAISATSAAGGVGGGDTVLWAGGFFYADATHAGSIQLRWAQNTATAEDNIVNKSSLLRLRRLV